MKNGELIKQVLSEYFSDYNDYHLVILIGFTVIIALIQIIHALWVSKKIEKFKNDLKKSEIKFSRYNEMQIKTLSESYHHLSDFNEQTLNVTQGYLSPEELQRLSKLWLEIYYKFHKHYARNKFIFTSEIRDKLNVIFGNFQRMKTLVEIDRKHSQQYTTNNFGDVIFVGDTNDLTKIHDELGSMKRNDIIKKALDDIKVLKTDIEEFFDSFPK